MSSSCPQGRRFPELKRARMTLFNARCSQHGPYRLQDRTLVCSTVFADDKARDARRMLVRCHMCAVERKNLVLSPRISKHMYFSLEELYKKLALAMTAVALHPDDISLAMARKLLSLLLPCAALVRDAYSSPLVDFQVTQPLILPQGPDVKQCTTMILE